MVPVFGPREVPLSETPSKLSDPGSAVDYGETSPYSTGLDTKGRPETAVSARN